MRLSFFVALGFLLLFTPAYAHDGLPLGDGYVSDHPQNGYIFSCQQKFGAGGADHTGSWINGNTWDPAHKPHVQGSVTWPDTSLSIDENASVRTITANLLPSHPTGIFPISPSDPAYYFDKNPNSIHQKLITLQLPLQPQMASSPTCVSMGMIGIMLDGTALFNGLDGGGRDAAAHEVQDVCNGHPEPSGTYHYHNYSSCLDDKRDQPNKHSSLMGYAIDGFGIFGPYGEDGFILNNDKLDACHGHTHVVTWDGKQQNLYHYHFTPEYPYSIGCYRGKVSPAARNGQQNPQMMGDGGSRPTRHPHPPDLAKVATQLGINLENLRRALGPPPPPFTEPDFASAAIRLGIDESQLRDAIRNAE